jgi:hypothetical protein
LAQNVNNALTKYAADSVNIIRSLVDSATVADFERIEANLLDRSKK